jgi:hypothetical protein
METNTLRPGLLVGLKTSLRGNVSYVKRTIVADQLIADETRFAKWETERTIADAAEHALASSVRREATYTVAKICAATAFGYLCPEAKAAELDAAIAEARSKIDAFNATAKITRISLYVITGRVAQDDVEAARAIKAELRDILSLMESGVANLDPAKVRDAARRAQEIATMLSDEGKARVQDVIDAARKTARAVVKATKAGEVAALAIDGEVQRKIATARTTFLDLDDAAPLLIEHDASARALDLDAPAVVDLSGALPVVAIELE